MDSKGLMKISSRAEGASSFSSPKRIRKTNRGAPASPEVTRLPYVYPFAAHVRRRMGCTHVVGASGATKVTSLQSLILNSRSSRDRC